MRIAHTEPNGRRAPWMFLVALMAAAALVVGACGGSASLDVDDNLGSGDDTADTSTDGSEDEEVEEPTPEPTATPEPAELTADEILALTAVTTNDVPAGYSVTANSDTDDSNEFCVDASGNEVLDLDAAFPPEAVAGHEIEADHFFETSALVYGTEEEAGEAFAYITTCSTAATASSTAATPTPTS